MMSADVKANIKQQKIKDLVVYCTILCKNYLQNLKYNVNRGVYIPFDFGWYSIHLDIVH